MDVAIGLPGLPDLERPERFLEFARAADGYAFSSLAVIDRIVFDNYEPLVALAAAAAVTSRIGLMTAILISPYRTNTALLAKELATLDRLAAGRLTVGIGIGAREDDYTASGLAPRGRARTLGQQIAELRTIWAGQHRGYGGRVGPPPVRRAGPPLLIAGHVPAALRRAARLGDGWMMGGGDPEEFETMAAAVRAEWMAGGRPGHPRLAALAYFALGDDSSRAVQQFTESYYNFPPDPGDQALIDAAGVETLAQVIAAGAATTADGVRSLVSDWTQAGCDELILMPCSSDPSQVHLLAQSIFEGREDSLVGPESDEQLVLAAADALIGAFAAGQVDDYFASFAPDASFVFHTTPERVESTEEYRALWGRWEREEAFRVLGCVSTNRRLDLVGDAAVFTHDVETRVSTQAGQEMLLERETIIFTRAPDGRWRAVHEHLSPRPRQ
jgi:alkanesulfonate monooxygenase SsuD/methylene tetrahydromethanopterin reductase-like flavin-dependent oxidoreductase (luciferase family)/ketosteroid isomerase-like protein